MSAETLPLAIAIGDPNGVGPEIALRAALALHAHTGRRSVIVGEDYIVERCCEQIGAPADASAAFDVHAVAALARKDWRPGTIAPAAGAATVEYVRAAVDLLRQGAVGAIAAGPHCEEAVNGAGIPFAGYGGLLADLAGVPRDRVFLLLEAQGLRVIHCTLHQGVTAAVASITQPLVERAAEAALATARRLGVAQPRVCVLGINPHAGEGGLFGNEDERVTRPAVRALRERGLLVDGPVGADLALSERKHDAYVAMLHDQGHIAVKMLSPKGATALVAGLPFLFASVGHGAAFDIAGQGRADASALIETVGLLARSMG